MKKTCINICVSIIAASSIYLATLIYIPVPGTDILLSAQTLIIIVIAALLPAYYGVLAVFWYLLMGVLGLPVFSNNGYGIEHLLGNTGGYLIGFLLAALFISTNLKTINLNKFIITFSVMLFAHAIILFFGWLWLAKFIGLKIAFINGVKPFVIAGIAKSLLATLCIIYIKKITLKQK